MEACIGLLFEPLLRKVIKDLAYLTQECDAKKLVDLHSTALPTQLLSCSALCPMSATGLSMKAAVSKKKCCAA